jgi:hypothetical protein
LDRDDVPERRLGVLTANAYLWLTYMLSLVVFLGHPRDRRLFVRHEDFLDRPAQVVSEILEQIELPPDPPDLRALRTGLPFHGNRLIRTEQTAFKRPTEELMQESRITAVLQFPWAVIFSRLRPAARVRASPAHSDADLERADIPA